MQEFACECSLTKTGYKVGTHNENPRWTTFKSMDLKLLICINLKTHPDYLGFLSQLESTGSPTKLLKIKSM